MTHHWIKLLAVRFDRYDAIVCNRLVVVRMERAR